MHKRWLAKLLICGEALVYDGIGAFGVQLDPAVRASDNRRHSLPGRVEFADIKDLVLL
jgi:hypothetical protein